MLSMLNKKAMKITRENIARKHSVINVIPGSCRYNFRCQLNAVHDAKKRKQSLVAMCVYFDGNTPIIHFLNYNKGKYYDNTLGYWSEKNTYYLVRIIHELNFDEINGIFSEYRASLRRELPLYVRALSDVVC